MSFFLDSCVTSVLESSCISAYTAVLRAEFPCSQEKSPIFLGTLEK